MAAPYAKTEQALTNVTPAMLEDIDSYAEEFVCSRAEAMRQLIQRGLDQRAIEKRVSEPVAVIARRDLPLETTAALGGAGE